MGNILLLSRLETDIYVYTKGILSGYPAKNKGGPGLETNGSQLATD